MRTIKIPVTQTSPRSGMNELISDAKAALRKFCTDTVIRLKLAPKSFSFQFDFHDSRRSIARSTERLGSLIKRALLKKYPFIEHADVDAITPIPGRGLSVNIVLPTRRSAKDNVLQDREIQPDVKKILRYLRKLQYLCRLQGYPIEIASIVDSVVEEGEVERFTTLTAKQKSLPKNFMIYHPVVTVRFKVASVLMSDRSVLHYIDVRDRASNPHDHSLETAGHHAPERLFLIIDKIIQVLATLTRKTQYAYSAFSIGSAVESSD